MRKKIILLLAVLLTFMPVYATTLKDKKEALNSTQQDIKDKKETASQKKEQKEAIQEEIKKVDLELVEIQDHINELGDKLEVKREEIAASEEKLEEANEKKDDQYEATKKRMVQMYKNQKIGYIQVVFSSNNFWDAINRVEYVKRISRKDHSILDEYKLQIETIEKQKKLIEEEKNELDMLQKEEIAKNDELETTRNKKEAAMEKLAAEEGKLKSEIVNLEEISENLKSEIQELTRQLEEEARRQKEEEERKRKQAASSSSSSNSSSTSGRIPTQYVGGTFMWPVPGNYRVSSGYVDRTSPIFGTAEFHTGIDIPANYGTSVVAAADGVVITAGWVNGYGNTVMISHGSGLVTLYGHNSSLVVSKGDSVKKGQTVAKVGSTGYSTGNHCHFEVRKDGDHVDPNIYLNN